ncbi:MAG TPA: undecaprenyl-diphosphate phosphatase [Gemmatimonadales bacterium]|jgi:undecaprenyl-diphosphatase|nr:undecaprenyl-diphosphate phosphatase [Gemmatimonadales bacterium]
MSLAWWQGILLGLVQGLTEFLPVSSSGHLVLAERLVGFTPQGVFFEVAVHVATLLAVLVVYRDRIVALLGGLFAGGRDSWRYAGLLLLGSLPAAVAGVLLRDYFERSFHSLPALGWQFLITAALLWSTRWALPRATGVKVTATQALLIGVAQAIAIVPAISRSGATIAAALWCGLAAAPAAEFSFLMSLIVIAGSGLLEARHIPPGAHPFTLGLLAAFLAAMISGVFAIRWLIRLLRHQRFHLFAPYCAAVGVFCIIWFGWFGK